MDDPFREVRAPRLRIRVPAGGNSGQAITVTGGPGEGVSTNEFPAKDFSITDDVLNVADAVSFTVSNIDGENVDKFYMGQRVEIDESDPDVEGGRWLRQFTGRITSKRTGRDLTLGGMDLGWHLTSCKSTPLLKLTGITLGELIKKLLDPTWGFATTTVQNGPTAGNALNRRLKQGRQGVLRLFVPPKTILPFIQVEPGMTPWQVMETYVQREGLLIDVGARGEIILFRPDYSQEPAYNIEYHSSTSPLRDRNNIVDENPPVVSETIDGVYSEAQCWSTVVKPTNVQEAAIANNPNAAFRMNSYRPAQNPLPFQRLEVFSDGEAINEKMRTNRAIFRQQAGLFQSWQYEVEVRGHSQGGRLFIADTMASVNDDVNKVYGVFYVQRVQRSYSAKGARTKLVLRKPVFDPSLQAQLSGAAKKAAKREVRQ